MKVLLLTDRMELGGAETHIALLARTLRAHGVEVTVGSCGGALARELAAEGIPQLSFRFDVRSLRGMLGAWRRLRRELRLGGYDIVHAHARVPAFLLRFCRRKGTVVTVHARFRVTPWLARLCWWGERTVAVSEDLREYVCREYAVLRTRTRVIPNGIDCEKFSPPSVKEDRPPHIVFASRMDADCSLCAELLCDIFPLLCRRVPHLTLTLVGGGSEFERVSALCERVNRRLGRVAVRAVGAVTDMPAVLRTGDVFVGVSRAALEAAACGCAVVLSGNEGHFGRLTEENASAAARSNFCARGGARPTPSRLLRDLLPLLTDPNLCRRVADGGRAWVCKHNSAERMCLETLELYQALLRQDVGIKVTVGGYFGCGNLGDDAILQGLLSELFERIPSVEPTVLTGHPRRDRRRFGVVCVRRTAPLSVLWALLRSRVFLYGGGSLLQNITGDRSLWYYLTLLRTAQRLGCRTVLCAAGIGPLLGERAQRRTAAVLSRCRYISLRDEASLSLLRSLGADAARLHAGADPAWLLPEPSSGLLSEVRPTVRTLCVVLHGGNEPLCRLLTAGVGVVCRRHGLTPLFLVFDEAEDRSVSEAMQSRSGGTVEICREPHRAVELLRGAEAAVSMRMHALLLAALSGTAAVGISADARDGKVAAMAKRSGQGYLSAEEMSVPSLVGALETALSRGREDAVLRNSVSEERKKAQKDLANIAKMIYNMYR